MNVGPIGVKNVRLIQYQAEGLTQTGVLFFEITDQATTSVQGNVGSTFFPLMLPSFPVAQQSLSLPILINEGDSCWNNAKLLTFNVRTPLMLIPTFSSITLLFQYDETLYPQQDQKSGPSAESQHWPRDNVNKVIDRKNLNWNYDQNIKAAGLSSFFLPS